jgi:hypothetical protein
MTQETIERLKNIDPEKVPAKYKALYNEAVRRGLIPRVEKSLWLPEYQTIDAETCYRFIVENIRTFEQASGRDLPIPDKDYLKRLCEEWFRAYEDGEPIHIVKSRRLIVSWFCSAIELFVAGNRRGRFCIAARTYEGLNGSQQFVYRVWYLYDQLCRHNPHWGLKALTKDDYTGNPSKEYLSKVVFPNGSTFEAINANEGSFQGGGVTCARIEELSQFDNVPQIWGQALFVTQGIPGEKGGMAYSISNASANADYLELISPT